MNGRGSQVFARCNFCNQSLAMNMIGAKMGRGRGMTPQHKASSSERKQKVPPPLPRFVFVITTFGFN